MSHQVEVYTVKPHWCRILNGHRDPSEDVFSLPVGEAQRRAAQGIIHYAATGTQNPEATVPAPLENRAHGPAPENKAGSFSAALALIHQRGRSSWWDVDGHVGAVQGRTNALEIAEGLLDG